MSNYSHMFKSRIRFFSRVLGCLWTVLPGTMPSRNAINETLSSAAAGVLPEKMKPIPEDVRIAAIMRMKVPFPAWNWSWENSILPFTRT